MKKKISLIISIITIIMIIGLISYIIIDKYNTKDSSDIFKDNINNIVEVKASKDNVGESYGTAVLYDKTGLFLTNAHVISYTSLGMTYEFDNIYIRFITKEEYESVTLVKYDLDLDLAILKIDNNTSYSSIDFDSTDYTYGDKVYAIGNTSNYGIGISEGIISVPLVNVKYDNIIRSVIQVDINISSGNSGGALLDNKGRLIGITTFRTKDNTGNVNYGFVYAIPINIISDFIKV